MVIGRGRFPRQLFFPSFHVVHTRCGGNYCPPDEVSAEQVLLNKANPQLILLFVIADVGISLSGFGVWQLPWSVHLICCSVQQLAIDQAWKNNGTTGSHFWWRRSPVQILLGGLGTPAPFFLGPSWSEDRSSTSQTREEAFDLPCQEVTWAVPAADLGVHGLGLWPCWLFTRAEFQNACNNNTLWLWCFQGGSGGVGLLSCNVSSYWGFPSWQLANHWLANEEFLLKKMKLVCAGTRDPRWTVVECE